MTSLTELYMKVDASEYVLALMEQTGATQSTLDSQREKCRGYRAELNTICPDGEYDPKYGNIVEYIK